MRSWAPLIASLALAGCTTSPPDGVFACARDQDCPASYHCRLDHFCYAKPGSAQDGDAGPNDAGPGLDAAADGMVDAARDAEPEAAVEAGPRGDGSAEAGSGEAGTPPPDGSTAVVLTLSKDGSGEGTVSSDDAAIDCGSTCSAHFAPGATVTLTAAPASGSSFDGWGGACSGSDLTCVLTLDGDTDVSASFVPATHTITITKQGAGSGSVSAGGASIDCGSTCSAVVDEGTEVTLTGTPGSNSLFGGWTGGPCSGVDPCSFTVSADVDVTATFPLDDYTLVVAPTGSGSGSVTSTPAGIDCGSDCTESYGATTNVTLAATPTAGSDFTGWSGGGCSGTGSCMVTLATATTVTATFTLKQLTLALSKGGNGGGTVSSNVGGINCGGSCSASYNYGTNVTLSANPATGSNFSGWSGGGCSGTGDCVVTVSAATTITASFTLKQYPLQITKSGSGSGSVDSGDGGISCGSTCSHLYNYGTNVTLSATAAGSSVFGGFSGGGCSGTASCSVTITAATTIDANFVPPPNYVFVTQGSFDASTGVAAADAMCQSEANSAGLPGTYKAWLSTETVSALSRLGSARAWVRPDGKPFADQSSGFAAAGPYSTRIYYPIRLTAVGSDRGHVNVFTGTNFDGTPDTGTTCNSWTSNTSPAFAAIGSSTGGGYGFTIAGGQGCAAANPVYCFGVSNTSLLSITPATGRKAFVTRGHWTPGGGIASADALCQSEATGAGLSGTFNALLATTSGSAASRFTVSGTPWVRMDGIPLAATAAAAVASGTLIWDVPLNIPADNGAQFDNYGVWSGGPAGTGSSNVLTVVGTAASTCNDWMSSANSDTGYSGRAGDAHLQTAFSFDGTIAPATPCNTNLSLACLQQ